MIQFHPSVTCRVAAAGALMLATLLAAGASAQDPVTPAQHPPRTRLVYDLSAYELGKVLDARPDADLDTLVRETIAVLKPRLGPDAVVTPLGGSSFAVVIDGDGDAARATRPRIESMGTLEFRSVATDAALAGKLDEERARLQAWLDRGGRDQVLADHRAIDRFHQEAGPAAKGAVRWYAHLVRARADGTWEMPMSKVGAIDGVPPLAKSVVAVFDDTDWNGGRVPATRLGPGRMPFLLEFVAIDLGEGGFTGEDIDAAATTVAVAQDGRPALHYKIRDHKASAYGDWTEKHTRRHIGIMVNGEVRTAPYLVSRITSRGALSGGFTQAELEALKATLASPPPPVAPVFLRIEPVR